MTNLGISSLVCASALLLLAYTRVNADAITQDNFGNEFLNHDYRRPDSEPESKAILSAYLLSSSGSEVALQDGDDMMIASMNILQP